MNTLHTPPRLFVAGALCASLLLIAGALLPPALAQHKDGQPQPRPGQAARYSCPMHPGAVSGSPGTCPKCGMKLMADDKAGAGAAGHAASATARGGGGAQGDAAGAGAQTLIPDVEVLDQDGRRLHFYTDLVRGKTVAINFIFTTCTTICPPLAATFSRLERDLGDRAGRDVNLISVSVDPVTDTPERMKVFLTKFKAGGGWTFVTGTKTQINTLLQALGAYSSRPEDHTPSVIVGNDATGQWTRTYGLARPSQLLGLINAAAEGRPAKPAKEAMQP